MQRWTLVDPRTDETYVFPVNPNAMTSPHGPRSLQILTTAPVNDTASSAGRIFESNPDPYEWQFGGFIRTQDHHDQLRRWARKVNRLELIDHLGRTWSIRITQFDPQEKRPSTRTAWKFDYTVKAIMYGLAA